MNLCAHCEDLTSGQASRQWNKVYRPVGIHFCLQYLSGSCVFNTFSNPFVDNRTAFYDYAGCWDDDTVDSLHERIKAVERRLYPDTIKRLLG